jgi:hypothetical protein
MDLMQHSAAVAAQPIGATVRRACDLLGMTRSRLYLELAAGNIRAWKHGKRTIIDMESARTFLASLPAASFRSSNRDKAA